MIKLVSAAIVFGIFILNSISAFSQMTGVECEGFPFSIQFFETGIEQEICAGNFDEIWSVDLSQANVLSNQGIDVSLQVIIDGVPQGIPGAPVSTVSFFAPDNDVGQMESLSFEWLAVNPECSPMMVSFEFILEVQCGAAPPGSSYDGNGGLASMSFGPYNIIVYPDLFIFEEIQGDCGQGATVNVYSANGMVCFSETGNFPTQPACNETDSETLDYNWSTNFPVCNQTFSGSITAECTGDACIPTIGEWGLISLTFLMLILGLLGLPFSEARRDRELGVEGIRIKT